MKNKLWEKSVERFQLTFLTIARIYMNKTTWFLIIFSAEPSAVCCLLSLQVSLWLKIIPVVTGWVVAWSENKNRSSINLMFRKKRVKVFSAELWNWEQTSCLSSQELIQIAANSPIHTASWSDAHKHRVSVVSFKLAYWKSLTSQLFRHHPEYVDKD